MTDAPRPRAPRAARRRPAAPDPPAETAAAAAALPLIPSEPWSPGGLPLGNDDPGPEPLSRPLSLPGVSLEAAYYAVVALLALLLRFWELAAMPLSPDEARTAMAALGVFRGGDPPGEAGALLTFGNGLVFALMGATDATARFLPALFGGLLPLTLLWGRRLLGRAPAAIAALLLALSPLLLDQARAVSPGAIAATLTLALVLTVFGYAEQRRPEQLARGALLLALALTAGAPAYAGLVALALFGLVQLRRQARRGRLPRDTAEALLAIAPANGHAPHAGLPTPEPAAESGARKVLRAAAVFALTLGVVATGALTHPNGVHDGLLAPLASFLSALAIDGSGAPLWLGPLVFVTYEPLALVLGTVGAVVAWRRPRPLDLFLVLWLLLAAAAGFASPRQSPMLLSAAVVPAVLLAAPVLHRLALAAWRLGWARFGMVLGVMAWASSLVLLGFGHVSLADPIGVRYVAPVLAGVAGANSTEAAIRLIALLPVGLFLAALAYLWRWLGPAGRPALGLAGAALLWMASVHAGWNLAYQAVDNVAELPRAEQGSVDARALRNEVHGVLQVLTINRKERSIEVDAALRDPLSWYLRGQGAQFSTQPGGTPALMLLLADAKAPGGRYAGQRYRVAASTELRFASAAQFWRWLIYRENPSPVVGRDVMLYVRAQ